MKVSFAAQGKQDLKGHELGEPPQFGNSPSISSFPVFQSETSFNLISEKCDILSILRDHPENRIYQRKIQVRQRVEREDHKCSRMKLGAQKWVPL